MPHGQCRVEEETMGKQQNNFKQAMAELLNGRNSDPAQEDIAEQPLTAAVEAERPLPPVERPQSLQVEIPAWTGRGGSVIAEEMTVEGKVYTDSPLQIRGRIKGSVAGRGSLLISGGVEGDVQCGELQLQGAKVLGNVQSSGAVRIDAQAVVSGDLAAGELELAGKIKGNLQVEGTAVLGSSAVLIGDLRAHRLSIAEGAVLQGSVEVTGGLQDTAF